MRVLIELSDKPVWSLASYGNVVLHEEDLRDRVGIRHDLPDIDGSIYVKIDRLRRTDPPEPPAAAKDWLTIGRDPFKEPVIQIAQGDRHAGDRGQTVDCSRRR